MKIFLAACLCASLLFALPTQLLAQGVESGPLYDKTMPYNFTRLLHANSSNEVLALGRRWTPSAKQSTFVVERFGSDLKRKEIIAIEDIPGDWWYRCHLATDKHVLILFGHKDGNDKYTEYVKPINADGTSAGDRIKLAGSLKSADPLDPASFSGLRLSAQNNKVIHFFSRYNRSTKAKVEFTVIDENLQVVKEHKFEKDIPRISVEYRDVELDGNGNLHFLYNERSKGRYGKMHRGIVYHELAGPAMLAGDSVSHQGGHLFPNSDGSMEVITFVTLVAAGTPTHVRQTPLSYLQGIARYKLNAEGKTSGLEMGFFPAAATSKGYLRDYAPHTILKRPDGGLYAITERGGRADTYYYYNLDPVSDGLALTGADLPFKAGDVMVFEFDNQLSTGKHHTFEKQQSDASGEKVGIGYQLTANELTVYYDLQKGSENFYQYKITPGTAAEQVVVSFKSIGLKGVSYFPGRSVGKGKNYYMLLEGKKSFGVGKIL